MHVLHARWAMCNNQHPRALHILNVYGQQAYRYLSNKYWASFAKAAFPMQSLISVVTVLRPQIAQSLLGGTAQMLQIIEEQQ